jgi:hypothetical protein
MARTASDYKRLHGLTTKQQNAIDLLVAGSTDQSVADAVGVHRVTVTKWRTRDPHFQAELNHRRQEIWSAGVDHLRSLIPLALDALATELRGGKDPARTALEILRLAGFGEIARNDRNLGNYEVGPTDPERVINAMARQRRPHPLADLIDPDPVTDAERRALLADLEAALQDAAEVE